MPELPDIAVYIEALQPRIVGRTLQRVALANPFVLRTAVPPIAVVHGTRVVAVRRLGKRIVIALEPELFLVFHLMIAGRLRWLAPGKKPPGRITLATLEFDAGLLVLTEAGSKRRASLHLVQGEPALAALDPGGLDVFGIDLATFADRLRSADHTVKRALTDPHLFSGIGNAYSDEILHRAQLSPIAMTFKLTNEQVERLYTATRESLVDWTDRLRDE